MTSQSNYEFIIPFATAMCLAVVTPMVFIRLYVNHFVIKVRRWEDVAVVISWLGLIAFWVGILVSQHYGLPLRPAYPTDGHSIGWGKIIWIMEMVYAVTMTVSKLPILVLYKRLFIPAYSPRNWLFYTLAFLFVFNVLYYSVSLIAAGLQCRPIARLWDPSVPGSCIDMTIVFVGTGTFNLLLDLFMFVIPVFMISRLRLSRKRKIEVWSVFACGIACVAAALARLVCCILYRNDVRKGTALADIGLWAGGEMATCIMSGCAPTMRMMVRHIRGNPTISGSHTDLTDSMNKRKRSIKPSWGTTTLADSQSLEIEDPYCFVEEQEEKDDRLDLENNRISGMMPSSVKGSEIVVSTTIDITTEPSSEMADHRSQR